MSARASILFVRPDSGRVELALLEASRLDGFVDAGAHRTFSQLVDACGGAAFADLGPADPWLVRARIGVEAPRIATLVFGDVASTADFALQADQLRGELWSHDVTPSFFSEPTQPDTHGAFSARRRRQRQHWARSCLPGCR